MSMTPVVRQSLLDGALTTIEVVALALAVAVPAALLGGFGRLSRFRAIRIAVGCYIEFFRGTSALVQLFWAFFVLPELGVVLSPFLVGFVVLGLNAGAFGSEIVRGAVLAVPRGQWEATQLLGLRRWHSIRLVIFPQALPTMLPAVGNTVIDVLKATSLVSLITVSDFTRNVSRWATTGTLDLTFAYTLLLAGYLAMSLPLTAAIRLLERRYARRRSPGPGAAVLA